MTENEKFLEVLIKAAKAAQRKALRKGIPYAISVNGKIEFVHPAKKKARAKHKKTKAARSKLKRKVK